MSKKRGKSAAVYVRVSSELQAEGVSPKEQEADCRSYASDNGHEIVAVYRDIKRYRVGGRLVEPSGTRRDRPEFRQMLSDGARGRFELVIAWKEDRLYRGLRPMLDLLDMVKQGVLDVELVKESFDKKLVPIKASIAEWELDSLRQRTNMGAKARLKQGKSWGGHLMFGYARDGDLVVEDPEEAEWVRNMYAWYVSGVGVRDISRRLIRDNAPPKRGHSQTIKWPMSSIYRILNRECYSNGIHRVRRDGQHFDLPVPQIIDPEVFKIAQEKLKSNHRDYARNVKHEYLLRGILTSPCKSSWHAFTRTYQAKWKKKSTDKEHFYKAKQSYYRCALTTSSVEDHHHPDCPKTKGVVRLDEWVWARIAEVLRTPELLTNAADARIRELKDQHADAAEELRHLMSLLDKIESQRSLYIEKFGRDSVGGGPFTEQDLDYALETLALEEVTVKRQLAELQVIEQTPFDQLDESMADYFADIARGLEWLDSEPANKSEAHLQFKERRSVVKSLVEQVTISRKGNPKITFSVELPAIEQFQSLSS